jgi:SH3-like domain-containing protein
MSRYKKKILISFFFCLISLNNLCASESKKFLSLKNNEVNLREGPSKDYPVKFVYNKKFLPVQILDSWDNWKKIKDFEDNSGWIHISLLSGKKTAINKLKNSIIFTYNTIYSKPLARVDKGRLLFIKKCKLQWCKVSSGEYTGWIQKKSLWGKIN